MTLVTEMKVPLKIWKDGSIRVKDTRLLIDMIIHSHERGETPENIFDSFPSEHYSLADVYLIISYYLNHKKEFQEYLDKREKEAEEIRQKIEAMPGYKERTEKLKQKLAACRKERNKNS